VTEVAADVQAWSFAEGEKADSELLDRVIAAGVAVNEADKAAFVAASAPIYTMFSERVPGAADLIARAQALATAN
jgi:TRAP-type C4-dicarboxylate transport system substrate-binding protein